MYSIDSDIIIYGTFCTPCLYGENAFNITKYPSCVYYTFSYSLLWINGCIAGATLGNLLIPNNPIMISFMSTCISQALISQHAGSMRTQLRNKYNIDGSISNDYLMHFFCSPCAICEETQIIRNTNELEIIPIIQKMEK